MALVVLPLCFKDFETIVGYSETLPLGYDLVANPVPACWSIETREEAVARSQWHYKRQQRRCLEDNTAYYIKVIDRDSPEDIIGIARWHLYASGYSYERHGHWERAQDDDQNSDSEKYSGFDLLLHDQILGTRDMARASWILPATSLCWILTHLVIRKDQQRRGAGTALLRWGMERAKEMRCQAYLEAGVDGLPLYQKEGFQQIVEPIEIEMKNVRNETVVFRMAKMMYQS